MPRIQDTTNNNYYRLGNRVITTADSDCVDLSRIGFSAAEKPQVVKLEDLPRNAYTESAYQYFNR